jgi:hypothetical protein
MGSDAMFLGGQRILFEFDHGAVQPVGVPGDDGVYMAGAHRLEQRQVAGPGLAAVGGYVVVGEGQDSLAAYLINERLAVLELTFDAQARAYPVTGNPCIDGEAGWAVQDHLP